MKVFLLAPYPEMNSVATTQYPPLGLLYLGGSVQDIVDDMLILDANILKLSVNKTIRSIKEFAPEVLGISINVVTAKVSKEIATLVREIMPDVKLVAGGPLPTIYPDKWLEYFDVVIEGEGEYPFREIIQQLNSGKEIAADYPGICISRGTYTKAEHPDLDALSFPAYDYLNPNLQYYSKKARVVKSYMAPVLTSRGCPYSCIFCDKSVHGTNFRPRSPESVIKEIQWLHDKYGVRQLDILDDNFTFDKKRAERILDGIIEIDDFAINCQNGIRADKMDEHLALKMKQAGVFRVGIGIESGNPSVLKQLNKKLDLKDVVDTIQLFRKQRITVQGYFIIGFPFENRECIKDTIKFAIKANPHFANFSHFFPIIGTPVYKELQAQGRLLIDEGEVEDGFFRLNPHFDNCNITYQDMKKIYSWAWRKFYYRLYKVIDIFLSIKSWKELAWVIRIAVSMIRNKVLNKNHK